MRQTVACIIYSKLKYRSYGQTNGRRAWKDGFNDTEREKEYVRMKESQRNESFADGTVGGRVRLMLM